MRGLEDGPELGSSRGFLTAGSSVQKAEWVLLSSLSVGILWEWYTYAGVDAMAASVSGVWQDAVFWCKIVQFFALIFATLVFGRRRPSRAALVVGACCGVLCTLLFPVAWAVFPPPAVLALCGAVNGFAYGVLLMGWADASLSSDYLSLFFVAGIASIFSGLWKSAIAWLPGSLEAFAAALPLVLVAPSLCRMGRVPRPLFPDQDASREDGAGGILFFLSLAIAGGAVASLLVNSWVAPKAISFTWEIVPIQALLLVLFAILGRKALPELVMTVLIGIACVAVLCALAIPSGHPAVSMALFVCTRLLLAFSIVAALWRCSLWRNRPLLVVGFAFGGIFFASMAAYVLSNVVAAFDVSVLSFAAVLLAFSLMLIVASLLAHLRSWLAQGGRIPARAEGPQVDIDARCRDLAASRGLTERERDVLCLLARGNSLKGIAEKLVVSENTVKSHRRHIYQKLGIGSRQSLIDLINDSDSKES